MAAHLYLFCHPFRWLIPLKLWVLQEPLVKRELRFHRTPVNCPCLHNISHRIAVFAITQKWLLPIDELGIISTYLNETMELGNHHMSM
jgi:hypothetical protein